jgi:hypothetical protein
MSNNKSSRGIAAQIRSLRTDKVSGTITGVFGLMMVGFASFGLIIVGLQRVMFSFMPKPPREDQGVPIDVVMDAIHGVWFIFFPLMIAGGIVFAIAGYYLRRGSQTARRVAQVNALLGYLWVIGYIFSCYRVIDVIAPSPEFVPAEVSRGFQWFSLVLGFFMSAGFPTGLLLVLCGSRGETASLSPEPAKQIE